VFVGSSSMIATAGHSADNRNVCLWDTLLPQRKALVQGIYCMPLSDHHHDELNQNLSGIKIANNSQMICVVCSYEQYLRILICLYLIWYT